LQAADVRGKTVALMGSIKTVQWIETPSSNIVKATNRRRWIDLIIVLLVAFAPFLLKSVYLLFHPIAPKYTNARAIAALTWECAALGLFLWLFHRQERRLASLGLTFRWTDLPKALALFISAFVVMGVSAYAINAVWFSIALRYPQYPDLRFFFTDVRLWLLVPFLLLNPFFEEMLVRGYLMTEVSGLCGSMLLAMVVSIALQTTYHLYYGLFGALVVGSGLSVFAGYYAKSRRLTPVILAHMLWDLTALLSAWHR
jgi:membrane protease YdiL (CAAX protease family)